MPSSPDSRLLDSSPGAPGAGTELTCSPLVSVGDVRVVPMAEWDDVVAAIGGLDTYMRFAYHRASSRLEPAGTRPVLLHFTDARGEMVLPLLLRPLPDGPGWDAVSAYGYGGPVGSPQRVAAFGAALDRWANENAVVTTFLRLHPLFGNARLVPPAAELVELGSTVAWDVSQGRDLVSLMHPHHRRAARRADRAGLVVDVVLRPRGLDEFRDLYEITMHRQQAKSFFFFPLDYWDALLASTEDLGLTLVEGRLGDRLVSALLCFCGGSWLHYHLGGSDDVGRAIGASNRCFLIAALWAQARGLTRFHLGGGVGSRTESSLFSFKRRFYPAGPVLPFHVAKLVHDRDRYRQLAGGDSTAGFFPPWRRED